MAQQRGLRCAVLGVQGYGEVEDGGGKREPSKLLQSQICCVIARLRVLTKPVVMPMMTCWGIKKGAVGGVGRAQWIALYDCTLVFVYLSNAVGSYVKVRCAKCNYRWCWLLLTCEVRAGEIAPSAASCRIGQVCCGRRYMAASGLTKNVRTPKVQLSCMSQNNNERIRSNVSKFLTHLTYRLAYTKHKQLLSPNPFIFSLLVSP